MSNRHIINMANSIVGVSILSMPYCFKEAGVILGICLLLICGFITKKTSMFLINSAVMSRRRSYELLAFQVFGLAGKIVMELCMILFLVGICISFHVVMGDLAPAITAKYLTIDNSSTLRATILIGIVMIVILPLCLLRNLDSLASMSACSIGFYVFLNAIIFTVALGRLISGSWIEHAYMFRFENVFRVFPIMTLALSCQCNVFEIYYSIPDPDVQRMETVVSQAVNLCVALYTGVGFLGYVAFIDKDIGGNIILNFPTSNMTDAITMVFVISLAISFPLVLFPCRTSIHSLLYKKSSQTSFDLVNFIPEYKFKAITVVVLFVSLIIGILLPSIEFVLGLLGSTMGMVIALILPSLFYIRIQTKMSFHRLLAQGIMIIGLTLLVLGTYIHLSGLQSSQLNTEKIIPLEHLPLPVGVHQLSKMEATVKITEVKLEGAGRKEPAIPEPPLDSKKEADDSIKPKEIENKIEKLRTDHDNVIKPLPRNIDLKQERSISQKEKLSDVKMKVEDTLHPDAIQKEEKEHADEVRPEGQKNELLELKQEEILKKMEVQQHEQKQLIEEQKLILSELKIQKEKIEDIENRPNLEAESKPRQDNKEDKVQKLVVAAQEVLKEISNLPAEVKRNDIPKRAKNIDKMEPIVNLLDSIAAKGKLAAANMKLDIEHVDPEIEPVNQVPVGRANPVVALPNQVLAQHDPVVFQDNQAIGMQAKPAIIPPNLNAQPIPVAQPNSIIAQSNPVIIQPNLVAQQNPVVAQQNPVVAQPNLIVAQSNPADSQSNRVIDRDIRADNLKRYKENFVASQNHLRKTENNDKLSRSSNLNFMKPLIDRDRGHMVERVNNVRHDEERRKRDLRYLDSQEKLIAPKVLTMEHLQNQVAIDSNGNQLLGEVLSSSPKRDLKAAEGNLYSGAIHESRQLLWMSSRLPDNPNIGRRKKKHRQPPDYWDEM